MCELQKIVFIIICNNNSFETLTVIFYLNRCKNLKITMVEYVRPRDPWLFQSTRKLQKVKASLKYESVFFQQA